MLLNHYSNGNINRSVIGTSKEVVQNNHIDQVTSRVHNT